MLTVWFNNQNSHQFGLIVSDVGIRQRAEEIIDTYEIPGRDGNLTIPTGIFKTYTREIVFLSDQRIKINEINKWLQGTGKLSINNYYTSDWNEGYDKDGYYRATVLNITTQKYSRNYDLIRVVFECQPFYYLKNGDKAFIIDTNHRSIMGKGTINSKPYIKIVGQGNIRLIINSNVCDFKDVVDYIEVDSERLIVHKDTMNQGNKMEGNFPTLSNQINYIEWFGEVERLEIIPRWREL